MAEHRFTYRLRKRPLFLAITVLCALGCYAFVNWATDPDYVVKFHGIRLGKTAGLAFLYFGALFCAGMALLGLAALRATFISREIIIGRNGLTIPKSPLSGATVELAYDAIIDLQFEQFRNERTLVIKHRGGVVRVPQAALPDLQSFLILCQAVRGAGTPQRL